MPSRPVHLATSGPAGAVSTYYKAIYNNEMQRVQKTIGGLLPDVFDPPMHPGPRALAHAVLPAGVGATVWVSTLDSWRENLRDPADEYTRVALDFTTPRCLPLIS